MPLDTASPRTASERHTVDSYEAGIELFYANGWTDGHPVFLPTLERVEGVLRGAYGPAYRNDSLIPERSDSPLEQLHVQRGFQPTDSTVTSFPGCFPEQILVHLLDSPEHILAPVVDCLSNGRFVWGPQ